MQPTRRTFTDYDTHLVPAACFGILGYLRWYKSVRGRTQRTDTGKYSFVNRIIKLWNQQPAEVLAAFPCKLHSFRKTVRKVVLSKRDLTGWRNVQKGSEVKWSELKWSEVKSVKWSWVKWSDFFVVSVAFICSYEWVSLHSMWLHCLHICPYTVCSLTFFLSYASFPSNFYYPFYFRFIVLYILLSILCVLSSVFFLLMYFAVLCILRTV
jgi:hypothetical protein